MAPVTLETARLALRPLGDDDLDALLALHSEQAFWRYPLGRAMTPEETTRFLERTLAHYDDHGFGLSAVVLRDSGTLAGWAGLGVPNFLPELLPAVEVGWRLAERFWGQGYATEAGAAWVKYGLGELGLERIVSICQPENEASYAVMMRLGMRLERRTVDPERGFSLLVTEIAIRAPDATSGPRRSALRRDRWWRATPRACFAPRDV